MKMTQIRARMIIIRGRYCFREHMRRRVSATGDTPRVGYLRENPKWKW